MGRRTYREDAANSGNEGDIDTGNEGDIDTGNEGAVSVRIEDGDVEGAAAAARQARETVAMLSSDDGQFAVACRETDRRPAPVAETVFETYEDAERARDAALAYRSAMRTFDPELEEFALAVCRADDRHVAVTASRESTGERRANGLPRASQTVTVAGDRTGEWLRVSNAPVVHLTGRGELLDDEFVSRQLHSKL